MGAPGSDTLPTTSPFPNATLRLTTAQEKALGFIPADFVPGMGVAFLLHPKTFNLDSS
jgi:hypothetical protein